VPTAATTLTELVQQLGTTYSPFERLKILSRAWTLLREMSQEQRMIVATQLGLDHADDLVEAIAKRSGHEASPALIAMIEKAQVKGTPHLPELISDLRDPQKRTERLKQGAQAVVQEALAGPPRTAPEPPKPKPAPVPVAAPAPPPAPVVVAPEPVLPIAAPPAPEPPPVQAAPPPPPSPKPEPPPPVRSPAEAPLVGKLAEASSLTARFKVFRRALAETRGLSGEALRPMIEAFPDGWARRRALLELLRSGSPAAFRDALGLVETLGSERDRAWCLGALAEDRPLAELDREALLAAVASPTARRRMERRMAAF
jgi:hypothetical protein